MRASPGPVVGPVGYPTMLELCSLALVALQVAVSWGALGQLPGTVVPYFGLGFGPAGLAGARAEASVWTWTVIGLWSVATGGSLLLYRAVRSTPVPVLGAAMFSFLAVLRAGTIALNLHPALSPGRVLLRAVLAGLVALALGAAVERWRSRKKLPAGLIARATYDQPTPRDLAYYLVVTLGLGLPLLLVPTRVRVVADGVLVITPISYFLLARHSLARVERSGRLQALAGAGVNLAASPGSAVRLFRQGRLFPVVLSVKDPDRFLAAVRELLEAGDS